MKNIQLSYYKQNKINPVELETKGKKWARHVRTRRNLYENHLKLPVSWFNGKKILEFGPNGGENSLILAMYGAEISLVEPHEMIHERIHTLYHEASQHKNLLRIDTSTLKQYKDDKLYDLVIAEGFIHALPDRHEILRKLSQFSSNFVIFSYIEKSGYFFESLKRTVFRRLIDLIKVDDSNWSEIIDLAYTLFFISFKKLETARTFESWVKDTLLNPCITPQGCNSFDQFIPIFQELNFDYYSSSPAWDYRYLHKWYKNINATSLKEEYFKNITFFISGSKNEDITSECIQLILSMTDIFTDYTLGRNEFRDIQTIKRLNPSDWQYANEINDLLDLIAKANSEKIINFYLQSKLQDLWGMPNHYVCLKRIVNE